MIYRKVDLYESFCLPRKGNSGGRLTLYLRDPLGDDQKKIRPAALIIPGGAYEFCSRREGEPAALAFMNAGYAVFLLDYTVGTAYPTPLVEAAMAMIWIREHAIKYGLDEKHVAAVGFSAGGHLAGMLATIFTADPIRRRFKERMSLVRPDAVVLCYPVITLGNYTHDLTARYITGGDADLKQELSLETRVTEQSSPAFLWHTEMDDLVPMENVLLFASEYRRLGIPFEMHIFGEGRHGLSVATRETESTEESFEEVGHIGAWLNLALAWLQKRGFEMRCVS